MSSSDLETKATPPGSGDGAPTTDPSHELPEHGAPEDAAAALASLVAERDKLAAERAHFQDLYLRQMAEFQNYRKRAEKERLEILQTASADALRELLPVLDDLERSLASACTDKEFYKGVEMIYQRLTQALQKLGLEPLEAVGKPFDPNLHHAIDRVPTDEVEENTVVAEFQRGYNYRGRPLRPAMVKVAVRP